MCSSTPSPKAPPPPPPPVETPKMLTPDELAMNAGASTGGLRAAGSARSKLRIDLNAGSQGSGLNLPV